MKLNKLKAVMAAISLTVVSGHALAADMEIQDYKQLVGLSNSLCTADANDDECAQKAVLLSALQSKSAQLSQADFNHLATLSGKLAAACKGKGAGGKNSDVCLQESALLKLMMSAGTPTASTKPATRPTVKPTTKPATRPEVKPSVQPTTQQEAGAAKEAKTITL